MRRAWPLLDAPRARDPRPGQPAARRQAETRVLRRVGAAPDVRRPLDDALGRAAGELLARTGGQDVIDAALVLLAKDGDHIVTSNPDDPESLARAARRHVEVVIA